MAAVEIVRKFREGAESGYQNELELRMRLESEEEFEGLLDQLRSTRYSSVRHWRESVSYFYKDGERQLRSQVATDTDDLVATTTHVEKERVAIFEMDGAKLCLSLEKKAKPPKRVVCTHLVRILQRTSFVYDRAGSPAWRIDLSRVWQATGLTEAQKLQRTGVPRYEVEIELLPNSTYLASSSDARVLRSFELKMRMLRTLSKNRREMAALSSGTLTR